MTWQRLLLGVIGWAVAAYVVDVLLRPQFAAARARKAADAKGKPLLNVGAGTSESSLRAALLGPTLWGDVNLDIAAPPALPGPGVVTFGDVHALPYSDGHFGAAIASHVLEHVDDPLAALTELQRVTEGPVEVVSPKWWAPHTWLYTDHQWFITDSFRVVPLWRRGSLDRLTPG